MTDAFPSALVGPSSKERKYDRQLRLWAASGQQALEESRVLLINSDGPWGNQSTGASGVVGVEALKNLVLPGIGGFTIVDPAVVTKPDLGVNFFLEEESLGKFRAEETCRLLRELNPDVEGSFRSKTIAEVLQQEPDFLTQHKLVLVTGPMKRSSLETVCKTAKALNIPVLYTHSVGFYSVFSLQLPAEFPIVETHPDPESTQDLRLLNPWPELAAAAGSIGNLESMEDHQHGHVPYVLLLLHYLEKWKRAHDGNAPSNYKEKSEFRELVRASARTNTPEGGEENYDEAVAAVLKSLNPFSLRGPIREIFESGQCKNLQQDSADFWVIASAVHEFYQTHQVLPLPGSLPDMKAQSADYVSLQNIYKSKARQDVEEVIATVRRLEAQLGPRLAAIPEKEIEIFCKNAAHIKVIHGRDIPHVEEAHTLKTITNSLSSSESLIPIFIACQVLDRVVTQIQEGNVAETSLDADILWDTQIHQVIGDLSSNNPGAVGEGARERILEATQELRRTEGGELHNISALTGGLVAQEALKVMTRQYVPLDNTCIFDGVYSRSEMYRL
ncbi:NEDD8-activating enzyme E1 regulatory subunit [Aspergillus clavatus NRRL 1]|uniref:NEDD8-activating enzyme E1 regulatory subunit n=1 Tax=Aspergillus clavatus (strain ATCC 1007 / CBS 513.65 / DSM 816 / NCTC 3887 / NRRL 1 / QM 1276 / 107) TaxID=344612 RepID=A1CTV1_ASPCL|nr:ubiquitin-like activating enzyme (UlaA), putative [Aspergillus clavatus NRRL 1]EAW06738.1 ubiquitin-like activating enzyme (UlaA), putative [Aspergillus clavatus NRRL 1]